jgi:hypothetical protein
MFWTKRLQEVSPVLQVARQAGVSLVHQRQQGRDVFRELESVRLAAESAAS